MPFNGKRRNYRKKRVTKKRAYKKRGVSSAVRRYVKRTIHSNIENKCAQISASGARLATHAVNTNMLTLPLIPSSAILQSVEQAGRIANEIRTRKCHFTFCLHQAPHNSGTNATPEPQDVLIFIGKLKGNKTKVPDNSDYAKLFQAGTNSVGPYSTTLDHCLSVNKDYFTVYKRLRFKVGFSQDGQLGNNNTYQHFANNDYKLNIVKKLDLTKHCPKIVKFNDNTSAPTNDNLYMFAYCVNANGTFTATNTPATIDYCIDYEYEDA